MSCTGIVRRILLSGSDRHYSTKLLRTPRGRVGRWAPTAATPGDFPRPPLQVPQLPLLPPPPIGSFDAAVAFACRDGSGVAVLGPSRSSGVLPSWTRPLSLEARQLRRRRLRRTRPPKQPPPPPSKLDPPPALRAPWHRLGPRRQLPPRAHPANRCDSFKSGRPGNQPEPGPGDRAGPSATTMEGEETEAGGSVAAAGRGGQ